MPDKDTNVQDRLYAKFTLQKVHIYFASLDLGPNLKYFF